MASDGGRAATLCLLASDVRARTLQILETAAPAELTWAPPGTSNHLLWHAGHALWLQDVLCLRLVSGRSDLPAGWEAAFGMGSRPETRRAWPDKDAVLERLREQLPLVLATVGALADAELVRRPPHAHRGDLRTLEQSIVHGWHDEACHQGEMYLLLKMRRAPRP
jgi:hypothetical protein